MQKRKKYDAVQEVREIRDHMAATYANDPKKFRKDLKDIRDRYFPKDWEERQAVFLRRRSR